jgi:hypothetical protein
MKQIDRDHRGLRIFGKALIVEAVIVFAFIVGACIYKWLR